MSNCCYTYFILISLSGFLYLLILSIFAFLDAESLKIKNKKHNNSGIMLIINSLIYLGIAFFLLFKQKKQKRRGGYM